MHMPRLPSKQSNEIEGKCLTYAACAIWLVSLALPGFMVDSRAEAWFGGAILLFGLLFGWAVHGWAAYANIFFVVAAFALLSGRRPRGSVITMLAFGATLPLFKGVIRDEGSGAILPVASWGWGAVLWIFSLVLLAAAAASRAQLLTLTGTRVVLGLLLVGLVSIGGIRFTQRSAANSQERNLYLSSGMAFTRASMCGVPLATINAPLLPRDAIVSLEVDPELASPSGGKPYLWLPRLLNYQEGNFAWITFHDPTISSSEVKVRVATSSDRPVLQARRSEQGAVLRLLSRPSGSVLYEQELRVSSTVAGRRLYCPLSTQSGVTGLPFGYDTNLLRAVGQEPQPPQRETLVEEVARVPCSLGADDKDGIKGLREWDGRQAILQPESVRSRIGFCSDSYIVLTYISEYSATSVTDLSPVAQVFDRKTLRPLATFNDRRPCPKAQCPEAPRELATGARISDAEVVIETTGGSLTAKRW